MDVTTSLHFSAYFRVTQHVLLCHSLTPPDLSVELSLPVPCHSLPLEDRLPRPETHPLLPALERRGG